MSKYPKKLNTQCRPEAWKAVVLRDEADSLLAAILTLSADSLQDPEELEAGVAA